MKQSSQHHASLTYRASKQPAIRPPIEPLECRTHLSTTLQVPGTSDLWRIASTSAIWDGTTPPVANLPTGTSRVLTFSKVTGTFNPGGGVATQGPDGGDDYNGINDKNPAVGGISGIVNTNPSHGFALLGVFVAAKIPSSGSPSTENYSSITSNSSFSPALDQVFFIGDGLTGTGTGTVQKFNIPNTATRLFLGFPDGPSDYSNNTGVVTATLTVTVPPPATAKISGEVFNDGNGDGKLDAGEFGMGGWTVYIDLKDTGTFVTGDPTSTTNVFGDWSFSNLVAGTYIVRVEPVTGTAATTPAVLTIKLTPGEDSVGHVFGEKAVA